LRLRSAPGAPSIVREHLEGPSVAGLIATHRPTFDQAGTQPPDLQRARLRSPTPGP
jgi:hypothetical protein